MTSGSGSDEVWRRVDAEKRRAQAYLDEHKPHYPKIYDLPLAHFETMNQKVVMAAHGSPRCGALARIETNYFGDAVSSASFDADLLWRPAGHEGNHVAAHQDKLPFRKRWKIASWTQRAADFQSAPVHRDGGATVRILFESRPQFPGRSGRDESSRHEKDTTA